MTAGTMTEVSEFYTTAAALEKVGARQRQELIQFISKIVGYPCRLECRPRSSAVDLDIFAVKGDGRDWLTLQSTGALGVLTHLYPVSDADSVQRLVIVCHLQNEAHGLTFI